MSIARMIVLLVGVAWLGCAGDSPPASGKCVGALYDPCLEEHDCMSNLCQNFPNDGIQVCSQSCDAQNPCPDDATCDATTGACEPATPHDCSLF
jgi:hypothetical protein